jgi:hypothetical protein
MNAEAPPPLPKPRRVELTRARSTGAWEMVFRGLMALAIVAAFALAWWSLFGVWFPVQKQAQESTSRLARLSEAVDQLDRKWSKTETARVNQSYDRMRSHLFSNEARLEDWLDHLQTESVSLGISTKVDFGKPATLIAKEQDLRLIPAKVSVQFNPAPPTEESSYQRLLRLTQSLAAEGKRADLTEMAVEGGASSVNHAALTFKLWASEEKP